MGVAYAQAAGNASDSGFFSSFLPLLLLIGVAYIVYRGRQVRRAEKATQPQASKADDIEVLKREEFEL